MSEALEISDEDAAKAIQRIEHIRASRQLQPDFWMEDGSCTQLEDPSIFFDPEPTDDSEEIGEGISPRQVPESVIRFCGKCSVRTQCLNFAYEYDIKHHIWGGKSAADREQERIDAAAKNRNTLRQRLINRKHRSPYLPEV